MQYQIGDVVMLKSGGPKMVVEGVAEINAMQLASCVWINQAGKLERENLKAPLLSSTYATKKSKAR